MSDAWSVLGTVADVLGILTVFVAIWGSIGIIRYRRRLKQVIDARKNPDNSKTAILSIGIGQDIQAQVREYADTHFAPGILVENYHKPGLVPSERFYDVLSDLQRRRQLLADMQIKELCIFYAGPVTLAMGIGSIFDNWIPVRVYSMNRITGTYEYTFTLGKGAVLGLLSTATDLPEQTSAMDS